MYEKFSKLVHRSDLGLLVLRVVAGGSMMTHGYSKFSRFSELSGSFADPFGLGMTPSLVLAVFAELVCALAVVLGIFTRLATIPIIVTMCVAFFMIHGDDPFQKKELALVYLGAFVALLFCGSGRYAVKPD